jgi:putative membrane protein
MKHPSTLKFIALSALIAAGTATAFAADSKVPRTDASFMKNAAEAGSAEVDSSKLALDKSSSADVKTFAQHMVDDHTKAGDELKALAQQKGVTVSDKPSIAQTAKIDLLKTTSGVTFDRHYASTFGVTAHQDTVALFRKEAQNGKDADVKAWAAKTLPTLEHHLTMAQDLKSKTAAEKTASAQ